MNARRFVLDLLSAAPEGELRLDQISRGAEVMGVRQTAVRVALTRLTSEGRARRVRRGVYCVDASGDGIAAAVRGWRVLEASVVRWSGAWVGALLGSAGGGGASPDRGLFEGLGGLRRFRDDAALYVRPDNLEGGVEGARRRLRALFGGAAVQVFGVSDLAPSDLDRCKQAFECEALNRRYAEGQRELARARAELERRSVEDAAAAAFVRGGEAISILLRDPLVPASWIDAPARRRYFAEVRRFDRFGRGLWATVLGLSTRGAARAPADLQARVEGAWS